MANITLRFTTKSGEYPGAYYRDFFRDNGLERAQSHPHPTIAERILQKTYLGPDVDGIGVDWTVDR